MNRRFFFAKALGAITLLNSAFSIKKGNADTDNQPQDLRLELRLEVEMFKKYNATPNDWGPAFRAALVYANEHNHKVIWCEGEYNISSLDTTGWVAPFDDGTISPNRKALKIDKDIPPEEKVTIPVYLNIPGGISLKSESSAILKFDWNVNSDDININQAIGIVFRCNEWDGEYSASESGQHKNRLNTGGGWGFENITIKNIFIGGVIDCIAVGIDWRNNSFINCGIGLIALGAEGCNWGSLNFTRCYSGLVISGWWLQRNANNYPVDMLPPYNGKTDLNICGWNDCSQIDYLYYTPPTKMWDSRFSQIDDFFDDFIWKTINSTRLGSLTPNGKVGKERLSSTLYDLKTDAYATQHKGFGSNPFRGIASRAYCDINRYGRWNTTNFIKMIKTLGNHRPPVLTSSGDPAFYGYIQLAYIERGGAVNASEIWSKDNDFFSSKKDIWNKDLKEYPGVVCQGVMTTEFMVPVNSPNKMSGQSGFMIPSNTVIMKSNDSNNIFTVKYRDSNWVENVVFQVNDESIYSKPILFGSHKDVGVEQPFFNKVTKSQEIKKRKVLIEPVDLVGTYVEVVLYNSDVSIIHERNIINAFYTLNVSDVHFKNSNSLFLISVEDGLPSISSKWDGLGYKRPSLHHINLFKLKDNLKEVIGIDIIQRNNSRWVSFKYKNYRDGSVELLKVEDIDTEHDLEFMLCYLSDDE